MTLPLPDPSYGTTKYHRGRTGQYPEAHEYFVAKNLRILEVITPIQIFEQPRTQLFFYFKLNCSLEMIWTFMVRFLAFFFRSNRQMSPTRRPLSRTKVAQPPIRNHLLVPLRTTILVSHTFFMHWSSTVCPLCGRWGAANLIPNS